ncbi:MAG: hypothetical protein HYV19_03105 [Gemmatimonadetes bacterium]|nr:hypothetical protein [Gemmatimonadota bacterium]
MLPLLLALQVVAAPDPAAPDARADSAVRTRVDSAIVRFQRQWRDAWEESQAQLLPQEANDWPTERQVRLLALHCHFVATSPRLGPHLIVGTVAAQAACPMWIPDGALAMRDERRGIDGALTTTRRWRVRDLRHTLRQMLDSAAARLPGDEWIAAQRLRFAIDDGDKEGAVQAAAACSRNEGYCALLRAHVLYRAGLTASADSAFLDALSRMPEEERCAWRDVSVLLPAELRRQYGSTPCDERDEFEAQFWMLSDPLWSEPGNERRAEQMSRKVLVTQLAPLGEDEHQRWRPTKGGEAVAESLLRYGWPTQFYWAGNAVDEAHGNWLLKSAGVDTAPPYVVREYSRDRLHTVPAARALLAPMTAIADDWTLNGAASDNRWWPVEHFARDAGRIQQLPDGQRAMLRRAAGSRFAFAVDLDTALRAHLAKNGVQATLFEAHLPDSVQALERSAVRIQRALVVDHLFAEGPALVGVELPGDQGRAAARTRFSVEIAPALSAGDGERDVSQPVFVDPPPDGGGLGADAAIARMLGSTTLSRLRRIGIYWEAYGFASSDTVEIALALSREGKPGMFERVVSGFGLWGEEGGRADVQWTELPGSGRTLTQMEGDVSVQMRSVSLDLRRQRAGRYRLDVSMKTPGGSAVVRSRALTLR